jgi:hypothetical protein
MHQYKRLRHSSVQIANFVLGPYINESVSNLLVNICLNTNIHLFHTLFMVYLTTLSPAARGVEVLQLNSLREVEVTRKTLVRIPLSRPRLEYITFWMYVRSITV